MWAYFISTFIGNIELCLKVFWSSIVCVHFTLSPHWLMKCTACETRLEIVEGARTVTPKKFCFPYSAFHLVRPKFPPTLLQTNLTAKIFLKNLKYFLDGCFAVIHSRSMSDLKRYCTRNIFNKCHSANTICQYMSTIKATNALVSKCVFFWYREKSLCKKFYSVPFINRRSDSQSIRWGHMKFSCTLLS